MRFLQNLKEKSFEMNELEQRAQKHKRKRKGLTGTLNPDAGNVEHNVAMFNHMSTPTGGPSTNPCGPMAEELHENVADTIELHYDELPVEICVKPAAALSYHFDYDRDEAEYATETVSYDHEVRRDDVITFIIENMNPDDYDGDWDNDSTEMIEKFVLDNFDPLFVKYQDAILDHYREDAIKRAEVIHSCFNESFEGSEYVIMAVTHDGKRQYYNMSSVPHWVDKGRDATIFDDMDEARDVWFKLDMKPFKRVLIPVYDHEVMNEDFYTPIPAPFEEKVRKLSYYDQVCQLMDKLAKHLEVKNIGNASRIDFEVKQLRGNASVKLHFLEIETLPGFTFVVNGGTDPVRCETEEQAIQKIIEIAKQAHFKTFDIPMDEELDQKYKTGQKVLYHGKPSKIFGVEYSDKYGYDLLIENPDFDPAVYTGSDAWKYKRIWVGEDVELVEDIQPELNEANYGGAFDIDPEQYFTRDDLDEFAEEVIYEVSQATAVVLAVSDLGINKNSITIELEGADSYSCSHTFTVDMRKIRQPKDLMKYVDPVSKVFIADWLKYLQDCTQLEESTSLTDCPSCGGKKFNDKTGLCIDCGYDEKSHGDTGTDDYDDDYNDVSSFTYESMKLHEQLYNGTKK